MTETSPFKADRRLLALEHFPYGLERSGEFTREQVQLLTLHGRAYAALDDGSRAPANPEEEAFVEFCRSGREPRSAHEKAWGRFRQKTANCQGRISSVGLAAQDLGGSVSVNIDDSDL